MTSDLGFSFCNSLITKTPKEILIHNIIMYIVLLFFTKMYTYILKKLLPINRDFINS